MIKSKKKNLAETSNVLMEQIHTVVLKPVHPPMYAKLLKFILEYSPPG